MGIDSYLKDRIIRNLYLVKNQLLEEKLFWKSKKNVWIFESLLQFDRENFIESTFWAEFWC